MKLIVFEGLDGSGKTTQITLLSEKLSKLKIDHIVTKEPYGTNFGVSLMNLTNVYSINDDSKLMLYYAMRFDHINKVINPALKKGKIVICDRFQDSSFAYQFNSNKHQDFFIKPNLTFFLNINPKIAYKRICERKEDKWEIENLYKINERYLSLYKNKNNVVTIESILTEKQIFKTIWDKIIKLLNLV